MNLAENSSYYLFLPFGSGSTAYSTSQFEEDEAIQAVLPAAKERGQRSDRSAYPLPVSLNRSWRPDRVALLRSSPPAGSFG